MSTVWRRLVTRKPRGMAERFNGRINELVKQTRFASAAELQGTLMNYQNIYNHPIPQRAKCPLTCRSSAKLEKKIARIFC